MNLEVDGLTVEIGGKRLIDGISFAVEDGQRFGLIGESGSGKSLTALAVLGLLPEGATVRGSIRWHGTELIGMPDRELAKLRGDDIGMVFQEARTALNPIRTVGRQIAESVRIHEHVGRREARERASAERSASAPPRSGRSITNKACSTTPPARRSSSAPASAVPPVARRSSTSRTGSPSPTSVGSSSSRALPYSSA